MPATAAETRPFTLFRSALPVVTKRFEVLAVVKVPLVAKRFVELAFVVVLFTPVKFCSVVEPLTRSVAKELAPVKPLLSESNVDDAAVPPDTAPQVTLPFTTLRALDDEQFPVAMKRFEVEAVVAKSVVVVAFEVVLFNPVKFWRVVEPESKRLVAVTKPVLLILKSEVVANAAVEDATLKRSEFVSPPIA